MRYKINIQCFGGRGASSGMDVKGVPYGTEYSTVLKDGNIKFITKNEGPVKSPMETMTKGRVYAVISKMGQVQSIVYFDNENKRKKEINLLHGHKGLNIHTHHGYEHNEYDGPRGAANLTPKEKKMVERVLKIWDNYLEGKR